MMATDSPVWILKSNSLKIKSGWFRSTRPLRERNALAAGVVLMIFVNPLTLSAGILFGAGIVLGAAIVLITDEFGILWVTHRGIHCSDIVVVSVFNSGDELHTTVFLVIFTCENGLD